MCEQSATGLDDVLGSKALADDVERFARVHIGDGQGAEPRAVNELIGDKTIDHAWLGRFGT